MPRIKADHIGERFAEERPGDRLGHVRRPFRAERIAGLDRLDSMHRAVGPQPDPAGIGIDQDPAPHGPDLGQGM